MSERAMPLAAAAALALWAPLALAGVDSTPHDLSVGGGSGSREMCTFCHTPHLGGGSRGLWSRDETPRVYKLYESSTLRSTLGQPTGTSRLCLACHDGTTAPANPGRLARGAARVARLTGTGSLGTDLSDDHPISFAYDSALALRQGQLADPAALPTGLHLDGARQLQCTTCHDPHEQRYRKFLRLDDRGSALCSACHRQRNWPGSSHATSRARWTGGPAASGSAPPYATVQENGCESCHRPHGAAHPARLLREGREGAVCMSCHGGTVASRNLEPEFAKASAHRIAANEWTHDPREDPATMPRHVACPDCHDPHQATSARSAAPLVPGTLRGARGTTLSGGSLTEAASEFEVCLRCHGIRDATTAGLARLDGVRNIRQRIAPNNASYHPVAATVRSGALGGLEPGYSAASLLYCTDCHNNDEWTPGAARPRGPHGSRNSPILERNYETNDPAAESFQSYALCYKCHNRDHLTHDLAKAFPHRKHVVDAQAPCAACHDAHGSRQNPRLIDFLLRDRTGKAVVSPSQNQRRTEYLSLGPGRGQCYLTCHGRNHEPASYP